MPAPWLRRNGFPAFILMIVGLLACETPASDRQTASDQPILLEEPGMEMTIPATTDFDVTGDGSHPAWEQARWASLETRPGGGHDYATRVKMLYSDTGLYVLFDGEDRVLTASLSADNDTLWTEDVYEFFFWTDEQYPLYFEYEISPLGYELPLLIPNFEGDFFGWIPWQYDGERLIKKAVSILGGPQTSGAAIEGWRAEVFVPYAVLTPLPNVPPQPGLRWRANFYRIDYDEGRTTYWTWSPVTGTFHDYERFGTILFE